MIKMRITGSWVAIPTPFREDGKIDLEKFKPIIDFQNHYGTDGLLVLGSAGESSMLSKEEKQQVIKFVVEYSRDKIPVFVGTTCSNTQDTIEMTKYAQMIGADGALMVMPSYIKPPQDDLYNFLKTVADQVDIPIAVYNNPTRVGVNIKPETALKMINIKNIVAFKEAMPDVSQLIKVQIGMERKVDILTCDAPPYSIILPNLAIGGSGTTSITGNLIPEEFAQLSRPWQKYEDMINSRELIFKYFPLMEICYSVTNPVVIKAGLNILGLPGGNPRLPLRPLGGDKLIQLKEVMDKLGVIKKYKV
jgi:4-hydroxy-tetrahydrodipicolinate synthase